MISKTLYGIPWWLSGKESTCQCRRPGFDPWVGKIPWRREWLPTPVFLPGKSLGQRSLLVYSPWGHEESDTTKPLTLSLLFHFKFPNSTPGGQWLPLRSVFKARFHLEYGHIEHTVIFGMWRKVGAMFCCQQILWVFLSSPFKRPLWWSSG